MNAATAVSQSMVTSTPYERPLHAFQPHIHHGSFCSQERIKVTGGGIKKASKGEFANSLGVPWKAIHIAVNEERVEDIECKWHERVGVGELVVLKSPYRSLTRPLHSYVRRRLKQNPGGYIHVVLGELRTSNPLSQILHQNAHFIEQLALNDLNGVVTTVVPYWIFAVHAR